MRRSFLHFGSYNCSFWKIALKKNDKNAPQKLLKKIALKLRSFCAFSVFILLKFLRMVDWVAWPPVAPLATSLYGLSKLSFKRRCRLTPPAGIHFSQALWSPLTDGTISRSRSLKLNKPTHVLEKVDVV